jgi:ATP-dependent Clp endopeptidase proteolytic subunit ClpP
MFEIQIKNSQFSKPEINDAGEIALKYRSPNIIYVNKFNEEAAKEFLEAMINAQSTGQSIIPIVVDSYGGEVYSLLKMVDVIRSSTVPVATICMGKAMSCGAVLLTCGAEGHRYMAPTGTVMIHDVASFAMGKVEEIKAEAKEVDRLNKLIFKVMADNCGKPEAYFSKLVHEHGHADWFLDADECKKHNMVNHIRIPKVKVAFDAELTFG